MATYNYSKTPVSIDRLRLEIKASAIAIYPSAITYYDGSLDIDFADALSGENVTVLDALVTAHTGAAIPPDVTPRQIRQALILSGVSMASITTALESLSEPTRSLALAEWEYSNMFDRTRPLVASVGQMLGWTSAQLDALWIYAGTL
jgi:hypothetical protein